MVDIRMELWRMFVVFRSFENAMVDSGIHGGLSSNVLNWNLSIEMKIGTDISKIGPIPITPRSWNKANDDVWYLRPCAMPSLAHFYGLFVEISSLPFCHCSVWISIQSIRNIPSKHGRSLSLQCVIQSRQHILFSNRHST